MLTGGDIDQCVTVLENVLCWLVGGDIDQCVTVLENVMCWLVVT